MGREEMQKDPPQAVKDWSALDSIVSTVDFVVESPYVAVAKWVVRALRAHADAINYHRAIENWYMDGQHYQDNLTEIIQNKSLGDVFEPASDPEEKWLSAGSLKVTLADFLSAGLNLMRYDNQHALTLTQNFVNDTIGTLRTILTLGGSESSISLMTGPAGVPLVVNFDQLFDTLQRMVDHWFSVGRDNNTEVYQQIESFLTDLIPIVESIEKLSSGDAPNYSAVTKSLHDLVMDSAGGGDLVTAIGEWAKQAGAQVDAWLDSQKAAVDDWANEKTELAVGWINGQVQELESWAARQFSDVAQRAQGAIVGVRKAATTQLERMDQLAAKQLGKIDRWVDQLTDRLNRGTNTHTRGIVREAVQQIDRQANHLRNVVRNTVSQARKAVLDGVSQVAVKLEQRAQQAIVEASKHVTRAVEAVQENREQVRSMVADLARQARESVDQQAALVRQQIQATLTRAAEIAVDAVLEHGVDAAESVANELAQVLHAGLSGGVNFTELDTQFNDGFAQTKESVASQVQDAKQAVNKLTSEAKASLQGAADSFQSVASDATRSLGARLEQAFENAKRQMNNAADYAKEQIRKVTEELKRKAAEAAKAAREARDRALRAAKSVVGRRW